MTSMKAVVVDRYGGPFRVAELPIPEPAPGQILVRVEAAGLNPMDWQFAAGAVREVIPAVFPMVIGSDAAGEVAAVGESVGRFGIGDKVYGQFLEHPIGSTGTFAEFVAIDENASVGPSPKTVDAAGAAALPTAAGTAFDLIDAVSPLQGKTVLVVGAGGGVGSYTVQLAAAAGAVVLGTARPLARERLLSYGAVRVIDHSTVSVAEAVRARYADGVDVLLDMTAGADAFSHHLAAVRRGGLAASLTRAATGVDAKALGVRAIDIAVQMGPDLLARIASSIDTGEIILPPIARVDLEAAPRVLEQASAGHADGKTVVIP
jgi:NADPH:quinone reductase-like Zn-dependent oxidoreductase